MNTQEIFKQLTIGAIFKPEVSSIYREKYRFILYLNGSVWLLRISKLHLIHCLIAAEKTG